MNTCNRRDFLKKAAYSMTLLPALYHCYAYASETVQKPLNLLFVFADQWRAQAAGYAGNSDVHTPNFDELAKKSVVYTNAISNCPVCSPFRASLMTGQYPMTHGVFLNDLQLNDKAISFAQAYRKAGYKTGYIGKWHLDGNGRDAYIPPERRQGFEYWKVLECTHNYNHSEYYAGNEKTRQLWDGYDAYAQTDDAVEYLKKRSQDHSPFALFVSWGSPHTPYRTAPAKLLEQYDQKKLTFRKNVAEKHHPRAHKALAGYYAHVAALDQCLGKLVGALKTNGLDSNTIIVLTSDHGDMVYSRGIKNKQCPWDESIRIPFMIRCPGQGTSLPKTIDAPLGAPDIMPTILGLSGIDIPDTCEGRDLSQEVLGEKAPPADRDALILCAVPFGQWNRKIGGKEYRGIRTKRFTYVHDLNGPWLLYDNQTDPYQQNNLIGDPKSAQLQSELDDRLHRLLIKTGDKFHSASELIQRCGYKVNNSETVDYKNPDYHGQVSVCCREKV